MKKIVKQQIIYILIKDILKAAYKPHIGNC